MDYNDYVMMQLERRHQEPDEDPRDQFETEEEYEQWCEEMEDLEGARDAYEEDRFDERRRGL
jgi:hypothetical protein